MPPSFGLLLRYHTANERSFHKALAALNALRKTCFTPMPERIAFLNTMHMEPAVDVEKESYCRVIQKSDAICSREVEQRDYVYLPGSRTRIKVFQLAAMSHFKFVSRFS